MVAIVRVMSLAVELLGPTAIVVGVLLVRGRRAAADALARGAWSLQWLDGTTYELCWTGREPARGVQAELHGHVLAGGLGPWDQIGPARRIRVNVVAPAGSPPPSLTLRWRDGRGRARSWGTTLPRRTVTAAR